MRWNKGHASSDVIDRRGEGGSANLGGLMGVLPLLLRFRYGWIGVILLLLVAVGGGLGGVFGGNRLQGQDGKAVGTPQEQEMVSFVSFVLDDNQATWRKLFEARGASYRNAKLVLYTGSTSTSCGYGTAASGPFYCPTDEHVYIDLSFYKELSGRFGAAGDFAQAYVIAHEIGHHVQKLLGTEGRVREAPRADLKGPSGQSVRLELQADCFAGIWARGAQGRGLLDAGDIDEALQAASAIGDDRLQRESGGAVHPESFTHGSAAQRERWLKRGLEAGTTEACDTFSAGAL